MIDRGQLILEGPPETVFAQREVLEQLQLGVPLAIELMEQMKAIVEHDDNSTMPAFEKWQKQILQAQRLL